MPRTGEQSIQCSPIGRAVENGHSPRRHFRTRSLRPRIPIHRPDPWSRLPAVHIEVGEAGDRKLLLGEQLSGGSESRSGDLCEHHDAGNQFSAGLEEFK